MEILDDDDERRLLRFGRDELVPRAAHLIAEQLWIAPRGAELHAVFVREWNAGDLAEELGDALGARFGHTSRDARPELARREAGRLAVEQARRATNELRDESERRAARHRVAARDPHLRLGALAGDAPQELVTQARLPHPGGRGHERGARGGLGDALVEETEQRSDLAFASDERAVFAEQLPRRIGGRALAEQHHRRAVAADLEARVEQTRRDVVDRHAFARSWRREHLRRAIDRVSERHATRGEAVTRRERHWRGPEQRAHRERTPRRVGRAIRRAAVARERQDERAVREALRARAERRCRRAHGIRGCREIAQRNRVECGQARLAIVVGRGDEQHAHEPPLLARERRGRRDRRARGHRIEDRVDALELRCDFIRAARARRWILREHARDERLEIVRHVRDRLRERRDLVEDDLGEDRDRRLSAKRDGSGEASIEHAPEAEEIRACVDVTVPARLLGRGVSRRSDDHACARHGCAGVEARDAEVDELGFVDVPADEKDVPGFHVAVDDPAGVRMSERRRDASSEPHGFAHRERCAFQPCGEVLAVEPLHREVVRAGGVAVRDVAHDRRVVHLRDRVRFAREAIGVVLVVLRAQDLQRDERTRRRVERAVHAPHPARAAVAFDGETVAE